MVTTTTPGGQRVSICMCTRTGRHLATFTRRPGSNQVAASCSCRLLSHQTLLWHHRLGHPSLPRLRGMHSRLLVSGLPRSLPPLPPSPAPPCLPCVEGRQRAAPHSSSFPPTTAPLQTLHIDVWGPARISRQSLERYFLLVVDNYTRYTTVFPLRSKGEVSAVLIPWIRTVRLQLRERFGQDLPVLRLHSDRGGEFSSTLLRDFCRGEGILQLFTLLDSPQQNGIAERRIGLVMEVARTSMIHAAAPHFPWPFAVLYAVNRLNLWPRVSLPETSPTPRWTGEVGDASVFRVWGSRAFVRDTSADELSPRAIPCVFLGFVPDAPGWQFYHPTLRRVFPPQDVTFDESVPFYRLFPYRSAPPLPSPLFLAPGPPLVDPLPPKGPAPSGVSQADPLPGTAPVQVVVDSGAARGAASGGVEPGGAESEGWETGGAEPRSIEPGGAERGGFATGVGEPWGAEPEGASPRLSPQRLREWFVRCTRLWSGASRAGGAGAAGAGGPGVAAGAGVTGGASTVGPGGAHTRSTGAAGTGGVEGAGVGAPTEPGAAGAGGARAARAGAVDPGAGGPEDTVRPRPYFVPLLQQSAAVSALFAELLGFAAACRLDYASALVAESESASPPSVGGGCALGTDVLEDGQEDIECIAAAVPRFASMLLAPEGDPDAPDIPTPRSYIEAIEGPYSSQWQAAMDAEMAPWKSTGTYVDEVPPPGANIVDGMWIFRVKRPPGSPLAFKAHYVARGFSQQQGVDYFQNFSPTPKMTTLRVLLHVAAQRDYELHSLDFSTATTLAALGFAPATADPSLFLRTNTSPSPFYVLVYVDDLVFATADTEALALSTAHHHTDSVTHGAPRPSALRLPVLLVYVDDLVFATADTAGLAHVKSELQKRHTCTDLGELRRYLGLQITRDRARRTITLTQSHMVQQVLQRFDFTYSSPQATPMSTRHSLSALPSDDGSMDASSGSSHVHTEKTSSLKCTRSGRHSRHRFWFSSCMCSS
ncbi:unnamed protein product [Closterium sp. NIES-54]